LANQQNTHLSALEGREVLVIERLWARSAVRNFTSAGGQPLHATTGALVPLAQVDIEPQAA
jgi:DNA-binding IclR family transcriptional regulator